MDPTIRTFSFVAGRDDGILVALCLEHDIVTQADTMEALRDACAEMLMVTAAIDRERGTNPWDRIPPPESAVVEFRALPDACEFTVSIDDSAVVQLGTKIEAPR